MLNFGASKPRVKGGPGPPGSAPAVSQWVYQISEKILLYRSLKPDQLNLENFALALHFFGNNGLFNNYNLYCILC